MAQLHVRHVVPDMLRLLVTQLDQFPELLVFAPQDMVDQRMIIVQNALHVLLARGKLLLATTIVRLVSQVGS